MTPDDLVTAALLYLALFLTMWGLGIFVTTFLPRSGRWYMHYTYAAVILTCAYYLFRFALHVP